MNSAANGTPAFAVHDAIALDGDKLKPREDQRKGGNGFGVNEDGAGYTLTAVDRHGVAYENDHLNRCEVARSLNGDHDDRVTDSGTSVVHVGMAQNTRDEVRIVGDDGQIAGALTAEPGMKQQTYVVSTNAIEGGDGRNQERIVSTAYKLDSTASNSMKSANPHSGFHETQVAACLDTTTPDPSKGQGGNVIISTNSNGEDIAPTISSCEYKMGQKQKDTSGGYVVTRQEGATNE